MKIVCKDCGACCIDTEMSLSESDIKRIMENYSDDLKKDDFSFMTNSGYFQLKNVEGRCFFFNYATKTCKIYDFRPVGCRIYPLTYDLSTDSCVFDSECSNPNYFYQNKHDIETGCKNLRKFLKEELKIIKKT